MIKVGNTGTCVPARLLVPWKGVNLKAITNSIFIEDNKKHSRSYNNIKFCHKLKRLEHILCVVKAKRKNINVVHFAFESFSGNGPKVYSYVKVIL